MNKKYNEIKEKRRRGSNVDYPVIKIIKKEFKNNSLSNNYKDCKDGIKKESKIKLVHFDYLFKNKITEEHFINYILKKLNVNEKKLLSKIIKENNFDKNNISMTSKIEFIEEAEIDIDTMIESNYNAYIKLEVIVEK